MVKYNVIIGGCNNIIQEINTTPNNFDKVLSYHLH